MVMFTDPGKVMVAIAALSAAWGIVHVIATSVLKYAELHAKRPDTVPPAVDARLERIEHAMDAIAIEVERISEAQRFTTKLLAERTSEPEQAGR